jgi:signal peptidase I
MNDTHDAGAGRDKGGKKTSTGRTILEYVVLAVVAIAVALLIQAFLVKPYRIPSESMEDTLLIGDRVLVDRISWRFSEPERGDIVVFHPPFAGPVLIKRIVGMPGDQLSLRDGAVYVNGEPLDEPYVRIGDKGSPEPTDPFDNGLPWSLQEPYTVPDGNFFVMGDNRTDSGDSREFGPVPRGQLVGQAFARYWPPSRIGGVAAE